MRTRLLRLGGEEHVLAMAMHHIISDGWSLGVLVGELSELYAAAVEARPARLPELPVQYADFAVWQRARLRDEALEAQVGFWRELLAGAPPVLALPSDRPRPPVQSWRGALHPRFRIADGGGGAARFRPARRRLAVHDPAGRLRGAAGPLRRGGDVLVGTPVANRSQPEIEG